MTLLNRGTKMVAGMEEGMDDLRLIGKSDSDTAEKFIHQLIDASCRQRGPQFKDYNSIWNIKEWLKVNNSWSTQLQKWVSNNVKKEEIKEQLSVLDISEDLINRILTSIALRKNDIKQSLVQRTADISDSSLKNFDWQVKLAMSSDKLASMRQPLANVCFELQREDKSLPISIEIDKDELKMLIDKLEAANRAVQQLRS